MQRVLNLFGLTLQDLEDPAIRETLKIKVEKVIALLPKEGFPLPKEEELLPKEGFPLPKEEGISPVERLIQKVERDSLRDSAKFFPGAGDLIIFIAGLQ